MWESIINSSLFSGLLGTCVGGIITLIVIRYSLNRQVSNERILKEEQLKNEREVAMRIVCLEFLHNVTNLINIKNIIIADNLNSTVLLEDLSKLMSNDYWDKYKFILWSHEDKKLIQRLEYFYFNLSLEIHCKITDLNRIKERLNDGLDINNYINKYIDINNEDGNKIIEYKNENI